MKRNHESNSLGPSELRARLDLITERELFGLFNIAEGTGRNRQSAGSLPPHYKVGREKLYKLSDVKEWIARRRVAQCSMPTKGRGGTIHA